MLVICCYCKAVKEVIGDPEDRRESHGICDPCFSLHNPPEVVDGLHARRAEEYLQGLKGEVRQ